MGSRKEAMPQRREVKGGEGKPQGSSHAAGLQPGGSHPLEERLPDTKAKTGKDKEGNSRMK